jgi:hypothetical protein
MVIRGIDTNNLTDRQVSALLSLCKADRNAPPVSAMTSAQLCAALRRNQRMARLAFASVRPIWKRA